MSPAAVAGLWDRGVTVTPHVELVYNVGDTEVVQWGCLEGVC